MLVLNVPYKFSEKPGGSNIYSNKLVIYESVAILAQAKWARAMCAKHWELLLAFLPILAVILTKLSCFHIGVYKVQFIIYLTGAVVSSVCLAVVCYITCRALQWMKHLPNRSQQWFQKLTNGQRPIPRMGVGTTSPRHSLKRHYRRSDWTSARRSRQQCSHSRMRGASGLGARRVWAMLGHLGAS
jgi:hypothetical protein